MIFFLTYFNILSSKIKNCPIWYFHFLINHYKWYLYIKHNCTFLPQNDYLLSIHPLKENFPEITKLFNTIPIHIFNLKYRYSESSETLQLLVFVYKFHSHHFTLDSAVNHNFRLVGEYPGLNSQCEVNTNFRPLWIIYLPLGLPAKSFRYGNFATIAQASVYT